LIIVHAVAQLDEHRLVLLLHQALHDARHVACADMLCIACLARGNDAPTIREQVGDHMRMIDT
jgi:hypothetical protein